MRTMTCLIGVAVFACSELPSSLAWLDTGRMTNINVTRDAPSFALSRHFFRWYVCSMLSSDSCWLNFLWTNGSDGILLHLRIHHIAITAARRLHGRTTR